MSEGRRLIAAVRLSRWETRVRTATLALLRSYEAAALDRVRSLTAAADPFGEDTWDQDVEDAILPVAEAVVGEAATASALALDFDGDVETARWLDLIVVKARGIGPAMQADLVVSLAAGNAAGEGIDALQSRVLSIFATSTWRAEATARTVVGATNGVTFDVGFEVDDDLRRSGEGALQKQWLATLDDRVRDDHAEMDGVTVAWAEPFVLPDGSECDFPGDPNLPPEQAINCRCTTLEVVVSEG